MSHLGLIGVMKKCMERILLLVSLVGGFGLVAIFWCGLFLSLGYLSIQLVFKTLEDPSLLVVTADIMLFLLFLFILTRRKTRAGFKEFWNQLMRNI